MSTNTTNTANEITIRFADFVEILLSYNSNVLVPEHVAWLIHLKDKQETFVHVEFPDKKNELKEPRVWRKKDWDSSYVRWQQRKAKSEEERQKNWVFKDNVDAMCRAIMKATLLDRDSVVGIAARVVTKFDTKAAENFGVTLKEWNPEDFKDKE